MKRNVVFALQARVGASKNEGDGDGDGDGKKTRDAGGMREGKTQLVAACA